MDRQKKTTKSTRRFKAPIKVPYSLKNYAPKTLFEFAVKSVATKCQDNPTILEPKTHLQWHNFCFDIKGLPIHQRKEYMSLVHSEFSLYFIAEGFNKYTFDVDRIESDYPDFFEGTKKPSNMIDEILLDIRSEINASRSSANVEWYSVLKVERYTNSKNIYGITLDLGDDEEPQFTEGLKVRLSYNGKSYECEGLDFDDQTMTLFVNCALEINTVPNGKGRVYLDTSFILEALSSQVERLRSLNSKELPLHKFLNKKSKNVKKICFDNIIPSKTSKLDKSQKSAFSASVKNDITFIWGPPGTGKSHTLATLIHALFESKDNTLVCCISNVAVDQLINKLVRVLNENNIVPSHGQIYRSGRSTDEDVISTDYLFPNDAKTIEYRRQLFAINQKIKELRSLRKEKGSTEEELVKKQQRIEISEKLKKHTEYLINSSFIVFSTIANVLVSKSLCSRTFDNIIIDEASMMSMPYLFALAQRITKRIIIVGDPQQLGPISLTKKKWLSENVFDYSNALDDDCRSLQSLLVQRRSHRNIVNLINEQFYKGKLEAVNDKVPGWVLSDPYRGVVRVINSGIDNDKVDFRTGKNKSRMNFGTHAKVISILEDYRKRKRRPESIGVITPYRGQVKLYARAIRMKIKEEKDVEFWESIKFGTIHTFQGSECDLIIFDIVESSNTGVGKLFNGKNGEQLVNVALSRAKYKLIVVGDTDRFKGGSGIPSVSTKVSKVLGNLKFLAVGR